jgi:PhnB protein
MATTLNPYIGFKDTARPALEFYKDVFGGELTMSTFGEFGAGDGEAGNGIMHGQLQTEQGFTLMAADTPPGMDYQEGSSISISLSGDDSEELRRWWDRLSADGAVPVPLEAQPWGDEFGMCTDRFGVTWMVNIAGDRSGGAGDGAGEGDGGAEG